MCSRSLQYLSFKYPHFFTSHPVLRTLHTNQQRYISAHTKHQWLPGKKKKHTFSADSLGQGCKDITGCTFPTIIKQTDLLPGPHCSNQNSSLE